MSKTPKDLHELIRDAANARTRINVFYSVVALLEDMMPGGCKMANRTKQSIVQQCKKAARVQLDKYDDAVRAIEAAQGKSP